MARFAVALLLLAVVLAGCNLGNEETRPPSPGTPADTGEQTAEEPPASPSSTVTRNTVRVGGDDAAADAAGVANALYPSPGDGERPPAVALVDQGDWVTGIAASVLAGRPIGASLLLSDGDDLPDTTAEAIERLGPSGSDLSRGAQVIRLGPDVARPEGFKTALVAGANPFERAAAIDRFFSAARGRPSNDVVLYSADSAKWAMPAGAWAARAGDAVLPVRATSIPPATRQALETHERPNVYLLGPRRIISGQVADVLRREGLARSVNRIAGPTPVKNAIAFARYQKGDFGWGVAVPGYNFTVANLSRPLDAAAAASLATRGVFAPLLVTNQAESLPKALENYFLSVQPGYEEDPGEAVYNRAWILGDEEAISITQQAQIDRITELIPVQATSP